MLQIKNDNADALICKLCNRKFGAIQTLERHMKKKIQCNRMLSCEKCGMTFKRSNDLKKHQNRKTMCEPIQGDPTIKVGPDTCIYCRKVFKSKYNMKAHLGICKIKNGGMELLFDEVKRLKDENKKIHHEIKELKNNPQQQIQNNINNTTNNNHFGHTFNFNFVNFGDGDGVIENILNTKGIQLLSEKFTRDLPRVTQISNRVIDLIGLVFRNPDHQELQGVYVLDLAKTKENAYYHEDGNWVLTDWTVLRSQLLQKLHNCLIKSSENKRSDIEKIIKYLFVLGDCGDCDMIKKLTADETLSVYKDIGEKLKFDTIAL
jgi:uncharacterized C2H2 Zn-finger protein